MKRTQTTSRVTTNVMAHYGRSLYALVVGLLCGRWTLLALGETDYGLFGLICGLVGFVSILNSLLAAATGRFFAFSIGGGDVDACRKWFNSALFVHAVLPVALLSAGYPVGIWAIEHHLTIPPDRLSACLWVWRLCCLGCLVSMMTVPFNALFVARQNFVELSFLGVLGITVNAVSLGYMVYHPGDWLMPYAAVSAALIVVPALIVAGRARRLYPECRLRADELWNIGRFRQLLFYAGTRAWANLTNLCAVQGRAILVNRFLGPSWNAAMTSGNVVSVHATSLSVSVSDVFWPIVAGAAGSKDMSRVRELTYKTCRLSTMAVLAVFVPLMLTLDVVMRLWLKTPPEGTVLIAGALLLSILLQRLAEGYWMAFLGAGKRLGTYSLVIGLCELLGLGLAGAMFVAGAGIMSVAVSLVVAQGAILVLRLAMGRWFLGLSLKRWFGEIGWLGTLVVSFGLGWLRWKSSGGMASGGFLWVVGITLLCELVFLPLCWKALLRDCEREMVKTWLKRHIGWHDLWRMYRIRPSMRPYLLEFALQIMRPSVSPRTHEDTWAMYLVSLLECGKTRTFDRVWRRYAAGGGSERIFSRYFRLADEAARRGCGAAEVQRTAEAWRELRRRHESHAFAEFVKGKTVAIVGNGPQETGKGLGTEIDAHDIVIRINNYVIDGVEEDYGRRTDVWVKNTTEVMKHRLPSSDIAFVVYAGDWMRDPLDYHYLDHIAEDLSNRAIGVDYVDTQDRAMVTMAIDGHPTTGGAVISCLCRCGVKSLDAYGFSFIGYKPGKTALGEYRRLPKDVSEKDVANALSQHRFAEETAYLSTLFEGRRLFFRE